MSAKSQPAEAPADLLSLLQAAALTGLNARTLGRYVVAGRLPGLRPGGRYIVRRLHLFRFLLTAIVRGDDGS